MVTEEQPSLSAEEYQHVVVLVHGTFARGASWTHPDSSLATTISDALGGNVQLTSFEWSGQNSHKARLSAGTELADRLRSLKRAYPTSSLHIVAHSHGGNVVAYALRSPEMSDLLKSVVCLGTPYIVTYPRKLKPTLRLLNFAIIATGVFLALLFAFVGLSVGTVTVYSPGITKFIAGPLVIVLAGVLLIFSIRILVRISLYVKTKVASQLRETQKNIVTLLQGDFADVPVLNIQTRGDEAAGYLRIINQIAGIPFLLWSPTTVLWITVIVSSIYLYGMAWVMSRSDDMSQAWNEAVGGLIFGYILYFLLLIITLLSVTLIALLFCAVWPKIFRAHALGFGEDGFMKNWLVAISASRNPPNAERSQNEVLTVSGSGLRHSLLYENERALNVVATWMGTLVDKQDETPKK